MIFFKKIEYKIMYSTGCFPLLIWDKILSILPQIHWRYLKVCKAILRLMVQKLEIEDKRLREKHIISVFCEKMIQRNRPESFHLAIAKLERLSYMHLVKICKNKNWSLFAATSSKYFQLEDHHRAILFIKRDFCQGLGSELMLEESDIQKFLLYACECGNVKYLEKYREIVVNPENIDTYLRRMCIGGQYELFLEYLSFSENPNWMNLWESAVIGKSFPIIMHIFEKMDSMNVAKIAKYLGIHGHRKIIENVIKAMEIDIIEGETGETVRKMFFTGMAIGAVRGGNFRALDFIRQRYGKLELPDPTRIVENAIYNGSLPMYKFAREYYGDIKFVLSAKCLGGTHLEFLDFPNIEWKSTLKLRDIIYDSDPIVIQKLHKFLDPQEVAEFLKNQKATYPKICGTLERLFN